MLGLSVCVVRIFPSQFAGPIRFVCKPVAHQRAHIRDPRSDGMTQATVEIELQTLLFRNVRTLQLKVTSQYVREIELKTQ